MKTLLILLALASPLHAGTIAIGTSFGLFDLQGSGPWPAEITFVDRQNDTLFESFSMDFTSLDDDIFYPINAANAATYGGDWSNVLTWADGLPPLSDGGAYHWGLRAVGGGIVDDFNFHKGTNVIDRLLEGYPQPRTLVSYVPEELQVVFRYEFDELTNKQYARVGWILEGEAIIISEPPSFALLRFCSVVVALRFGMFLRSRVSRLTNLRPPS